MGDDYRLAPNSYLGEVYWVHHIHFGSLEFIFQSQIGMRTHGEQRDFLNTTTQSAEQLWKFFDKEDGADDTLLLTLYAETEHETVLARITTKFLFGDEISDEDFLRFIDDLLEYARERPLVDPEKAESFEITPEDINNYFVEAIHGPQYFEQLVEGAPVPEGVWLESLEFLEAPEPGNWIPWPAELP